MPTFRLAEARGLARLAVGLPAFLRDRLSYDDAARLVANGVARRGERFVAKLERAVFGHPSSPYLALARSAGCELGDLRELVRADGVEATLEVMRRAGIYVTWGELRGRRPAVRGSRSFAFRWGEFDNPFVRPQYHSTSGGSSGAPTRVGLDLEHDAQSAPTWAVLFRAHGLENSPLAFWTPTHAGVVSRFLKCSKFGKDLEKWFAMARVKAFEDRARSAVVYGLARLCAGYPRPEDAPLAQADRVLAYLFRRLEDGVQPVLNTSPSAAALLSGMARERGRSLAGVCFLLGAEPVTPARRRTIEASGAKTVATYGTSEAGWIGAQFPGSGEPDEVHLFSDAYAVIANGSGEGPRPLLFTGLRPAAPKVLLNAEIGDSGVIETAPTGSPAEAYGYGTRLHNIRSFRKVTVWGTTFAVADLEGIVEEHLPSCFGGAPTDYQLLELEDEHGKPVLKLLVSPSVGAVDEEAMKRAFFAKMSRGKASYRFMAEEVRSMDTLSIERRKPEATQRGKIVAVVPKRAA